MKWGLKESIGDPLQGVCRSPECDLIFWTDVWWFTISKASKRPQRVRMLFWLKDLVIHHLEGWLEVKKHQNQWLFGWRAVWFTISRAAKASQFRNNSCLVERVCDSPSWRLLRNPERSEPVVIQSFSLTVTMAISVQYFTLYNVSFSDGLGTWS